AGSLGTGPYTGLVAPLTVALVFGGRSGEHEISLRSAASVTQGLSLRYAVLPVLIDGEGGWWLQEGPGVSEHGGEPVFLAPSPAGGRRRWSRRWAGPSSSSPPTSAPAWP